MKQVINRNKMKKILLGLAVAVVGLLSFSLNCYAAPTAYTDLMEDAEYRADRNDYVHGSGDGILVEDYTLPEGTAFYWYGGSLTIPKGVTLTISEGSSLEMSVLTTESETPYFLLEEGATIRILGGLEADEYGAYKSRLNFIHTKAVINGTIESMAQGMDAGGADIRLNGNIYADGPALQIEQSEVSVSGGEYLTGDSPFVLKKYEGAYENIITIYGGTFSEKPVKDFLAAGAAAEEKEDGTFEVTKVPEGEPKTPSLDGHGSAAQKAKGAFAALKELCKKGVEKAEDVFREAVDKNGGMKNAWKNKEFLVCMIMVFGILAAVLYCIYDFIRAPFKKKLKILWEAVLVLVIVGGGYYLIWQYVMKDMEAESNLTRPQYLETQTIEKGTVKDNRSAMKGLDAYGPGIYAVGKDIEAGVYFFEAMDLGQSICPFYVYFSKTPDFAEKEIGLWNLRSFIELEEGWYVAVIDACFLPEGEQKAYEPTESEGSSVFGAGEYLVGRDFTPGTYTYEPANGEVFFLEVRDKAIAANEVSWSNHTLYSGERFDMGREECIITLKEGQLFGIAPRAKMRLKNIESE